MTLKTNNLLLIFVYVIWGSSFMVLANSVMWSDSEIWSITLGARLGDQWHHFWVWSRPFFHGLLWLTSLPAGDSAEIFQAARWLSGFNGFLIVLWTYMLARRAWDSKSTAFLASAILATHPTFLHQGFRVRADSLAVNIILMGCLVFPGRPWLSGALSLLATPKGLVLGMIPVSLWDFRAWRRRWLPATLFGVTMAALTLAPHKDYIINLAAQGLFSSWRNYVDVSSNLLALLRLTPWLGLIVLIALWRPVTTEHGKRWHRALILLTLLWLFFPERTPYFLAATLPFLVVAVAGPLVQFFGLISKIWLRRVVTTSFSALLIGTWLFHVWHNLNHNTSKMQVETLRRLENYWRQNGEPRIYDVIGLVPRSNFVWHFLGPHQERTNSLVTQTLQRERPELIFAVARIAHGGPILADYVEQHYVPIGGGVWARASKVVLRRSQDVLDLLTKTESLYPNVRTGSEIVYAYIRSVGNVESREVFSERVTWSEFSQKLRAAIVHGPVETSFTPLPPIYLPRDISEVFTLDLQPLKLW